MAHAGREGEARAQAAELLARNPGYMRILALASPFRHPWMAALFLEGLQRAGVSTS
jgi:hypothetical protein